MNTIEKKERERIYKEERKWRKVRDCLEISRFKTTNINFYW
jgi:hypothetical protein